MTASLFALAAAACFGGALVVAQSGFRHTTPLAGGTISITFTAVVWLVMSPLLVDFSVWHVGGLLLFAAVGVFYPAVVMSLTYESNRMLGPTLTGAAGSTTPLFAAAAAVVALGENIAPHVVIGGCITVVGLVLLALRAPLRAAPSWYLVLPLAGAALRAIAQTVTKLGLVLLPSPFTAAVIGYLASTAVMWGLSLAGSRHSTRYTHVAIIWFIGVGILNGSAVLLMYHALNVGSVPVVSTIVATYPLFTLAFSAAFLRTEKLTIKTALSIIIVVIGITTVVNP